MNLNFCAYLYFLMRNYWKLTYCAKGVWTLLRVLISAKLLSRKFLSSYTPTNSVSECPLYLILPSTGYYFYVLIFTLNYYWIWKHWNIFIYLKFLMIDFRVKERGKGEREKEGERSVTPFIYVIGWFLYVPCLKIEPTILAYWDNVLTNWATRHD